MTSPLFDLSGKVALITGGNGGIGLGMAAALAQQGAGVAISGTNEQKNAEALAALEKKGAKAQAYKLDVTQEDAVEAHIRDVLRDFGRIDTVIANAGVSGSGAAFTDTSAEEFHKVLRVNLDGVFFTLRSVARHMVERTKDGDAGGSLVGIASLAGIEGAARNAHYGATKGGVIAMMRALAAEYGRYGIRANAILPGWIATDMTERLQNWDAFQERVISRVPLGRWGEPADFGGIAVYLASDASRFHSGDTLVVDGGYAIF